MKNKLITLCKKHKIVFCSVCIICVCVAILHIFLAVSLLFLMKCVGLLALLAIGLYGFYAGPEKTEIHNSAKGMQLIKTPQWGPIIATRGSFIVLLITACFDPLGLIAMSLYGICIGLLMKPALISQSTKVIFKDF